MNTPTATLVFPLPECRHDLHLATHAPRMLSTLMEVDQQIRSHLKHDMGEPAADLLARLRTSISEDLAFFEGV